MSNIINPQTSDGLGLAVELVGPQGGGYITPQSSATGMINNIPLGIYNATIPTLVSGQIAPLQETINGFLKASLADLLAGEDLTANVLKVEQRFNSSHYSGAQSNAQVKATPGYVAGVLIGIQGTGVCVITIADDSVTSNSATVVANLDANQATGLKGFIPLMRIFSQQITVSSTGTAYPDFTVIYR